MNLLEKTRAAEKEAQLARLAAKGTPEYPALYAAQPSQLRKAAGYNATRALQRDAKNAVNQTKLDDATEAAGAFGTLEVN